MVSFFFFFFFRRGLILWLSRLSWNSQWDPRSFLLQPVSAGIPGVCHQAQLSLLLVNTDPVWRSILIMPHTSLTLLIPGLLSSGIGKPQQRLLHPQSFWSCSGEPNPRSQEKVAKWSNSIAGALNTLTMAEGNRLNRGLPKERFIHVLTLGPVCPHLERKFQRYN